MSSILGDAKSGSGLVRLSAFIRPHEGHYMAALKAFFDDSKRSVVTFAGFIGTVDQWRRFEVLWDRLLERFSIPYFHMKEFAPSTGVFKSWKGDETRRRALIQE